MKQKKHSVWSAFCFVKGLKLLAVYSAHTAQILQQHKTIAFVKAMCARIVTANTKSNPFYAFRAQMLF